MNKETRQTINNLINDTIGNKDFQNTFSKYGPQTRDEDIKRYDILGTLSLFYAQILFPYWEKNFVKERMLLSARERISVRKFKKILYPAPDCIMYTHSNTDLFVEIIQRFINAHDVDEEILIEAFKLNKYIAENIGYISDTDMYIDDYINISTAKMCSLYMKYIAKKNIPIDIINKYANVQDAYKNSRIINGNFAENSKVAIEMFKPIYYKSKDMLEKWFDINEFIYTDVPLKTLGFTHIMEYNNDGRTVMYPIRKHIPKNKHIMETETESVDIEEEFENIKYNYLCNERLVNKFLLFSSTDCRFFEVDRYEISSSTYALKLISLI